jgi:hypothetical protein
MRTISQVLTANQVWPLNISGNYFEVLAVSGNVGVNVSFLRGQVEITNAAMVDVLPGTYAIPDGGFDTLLVSSPVAQTVKIAVASGQGGSRRIAGEVSVIDGSIASAVAGQCFLGHVWVAALAANFSHVQIFNPVANTQSIIVWSLEVFSLVGGYASLRRHNAALSTAYSPANPQNKRLAGAASASQLFTQQNGSLIGTFISWIPVAAAAISPRLLKEPIVIPPGQGLVIAHNTVNSDLNLLADIREQL